MSDKVIYTGHFVEDPDDLLRRLPPRVQGEGTQIHAHHVTKEFRPKNGAEGVTPGKQRTLHIIGEVATDDVHAVLVRSPDGEPISSNKHPHLTIATAAGVPPVASNEAIAAAVAAGTVRPVDPPVELRVVEGYYDGSNAVKK